MILFHSILVLGGMVSGVIAFFCLPEEQVLALQQYLLVQMQELTGTAVLAEVAGRILRANVMDLIRLYLSGACLAGLPLLLLLLFLKGFSFGFTACFLLRHSILLLLTRLLYFPFLIGAAALGCRFNLLLLQKPSQQPSAAAVSVYRRFWRSTDTGAAVQLYRWPELLPLSTTTAVKGACFFIWTFGKKNRYTDKSGQEQIVFLQR